MGKTQCRRRLVATTGMAVFIAVLVWIVSAFDTSAAAPAAASVQSSFGLFVLPVITLAGTVVLTWYLLSREAHETEPDVGTYVECGSCGRSILSEWRLCPFCGSRVAKPVVRPTVDRA